MSCEGNGNAGVGSGGGVVPVSAYMGGAYGSGVLCSASDVFGSRLCERCWCEFWVWALPILEEQGKSGICVCVLFAVVLGEWMSGLGQGMGRLLSLCLL